MATNWNGSYDRCPGNLAGVLQAIQHARHLSRTFLESLRKFTKTSYSKKSRQKQKRNHQNLHATMRYSHLCGSILTMKTTHHFPVRRKSGWMKERQTKRTKGESRRKKKRNMKRKWKMTMKKTKQQQQQRQQQQQQQTWPSRPTRWYIRVKSGNSCLTGCRKISTAMDATQPSGSP